MRKADSPNADDGSYDQLVAYLDGELDVDSSLKIERRLAEDEDFRRELRELQNVWDILDELPKSDVSDSFARTTVEMVVLSAEHDLQQREVAARHRNRLWWLVGASGFLGAVLAGYWFLALWWARPNEQLVQDLPVIEDIELYRVVESVEYLRQLDGSGLFGEEVKDAL